MVHEIIIRFSTLAEGVEVSEQETRENLGERRHGGCGRGVCTVLNLIAEKSTKLIMVDSYPTSRQDYWASMSFCQSTFIRRLAKPTTHAQSGRQLARQGSAPKTGWLGAPTWRRKLTLFLSPSIPLLPLLIQPSHNFPLCPFGGPPPSALKVPALAR